MKHIILLVHSVSLLFGLSALTVKFLLFIKYRNRTLRNYLVLYLIVTLLYCNDFTAMYSELFITNVMLKATLISLSGFFYVLFIFSISFYLPVFLHQLLENPLSSWKKILYGGLLGVLYIASLVFIRKMPDFSVLLGDGIFYLSVAYGVITVRRFKSAIRVNALKKSSHVLFALVLLFYPLFVLETVFGNSFPFHGDLSVNSSLILMSFYLLWSILSLFYAARYFFSSVTRDSAVIPSSFVEQYDISGREKTVLELVLVGKSNKAAAFELHIAQKTVKNHLYNIYRKVGVQSRVEMVNLVREFSVRD